MAENANGTAGIALAEEPRIPPGPSLPATVQGLAMLLVRRETTAVLRRRYGSSFTMRLAPFGNVVVISDPALVKQLFMTKPAIAGNVKPNLGRVLGNGSVFNLDGEEHRQRRKLLTPPFHGRRLKAYEGLMAEEALREAATWPQGKEFETLEPFMRITLNIILRAVFGAEGSEQGRLREILPPLVTLGSRLALLPDRGPIAALGPRRRFLDIRRRYDEVVAGLIAAAVEDPRLDERDDVLAMLLQSRYEDGEPMTHRHVADELLTLLAAGHETTATTLAWTVERLRRHPRLLQRLVEEVDAGGSELRHATILEVQRTRPVIVATARRVNAPALHLGEWVIPRGYTVMVGIDLMQSDESVFPRARTFDPDRFLGVAPDTYSWIPFGGGTRRCVGAAFATLELDVVLRTLLREFELRTTYAPGERWHSRGVAFAPAKGGRAIVYRRTTPVRIASGDTVVDVTDRATGHARQASA
jgi:cytochrome P450